MSALALPTSCTGAPLWRASELAAQDNPTRPSGHAALDAELPGGGWPLGTLIDVLLPPQGQHEWRLLLPALRQTPGTVVLVGCPQLPHLPALAAHGLAAQRLLHITANTPVERLWVAEQALGCHALGALLVWLPQPTPAGALRRLQLAAHALGAAGARPPLVLAFRPTHTRHQACAAPLRLAVQAHGRHGLRVEVFKRRGPPLDRVLHLNAELPAWACWHRAPEPAPLPHVVDRLRPAAATALAA